MRLRGFPTFLGTLLAVVVLIQGPVWSQTQKRLSAREIFYSAPAEAPPAKKAAAKPAAPVKKKTEVESAQTKPLTPPPPPANSPSRTPSGGQVVPASYSNEPVYPLGLRYSILKREGGESVEVTPGAVFRSGDRIRLRVEANSDGYLYIVHRGSSGVWKPLFPSSEVAGGSNKIEKGKSYEIPSGYVFTFDEQPGEEKLFIVLSRRTESDLEGLIYSLSGNPKPAEPAQPPQGKVMLAQNMVNISDGVVNQMRDVYARDLIIERVDETTPAAASAPAKEKAVYVVNPARSGDSRVVADVTLTHK
jgi:hypothetical protein